MDRALALHQPTLFLGRVDELSCRTSDTLLVLQRIPMGTGDRVLGEVQRKAGMSDSEECLDRDSNFPILHFPVQVFDEAPMHFWPSGFHETLSFW